MTLLLLKPYGDLKAQIHVSLLHVKDVELRQLLADIIPVQGIALFPAIVLQPQGTGDLVVEIVKIDTGIHAAVEHADILSIVLEVPIPENENLVGDKAALFKVALQDAVFIMKIIQIFGSRKSLLNYVKVVRSCVRVR